MPREIDMELFAQAVNLTATALRGGMGGEGSQPPAFAADVFREVWEALKGAAEDLPEKPRAGFTG